MMRSCIHTTVGKRFARCRWLLLGLLAVFAAPGCGHKEEATITSVSEPLTVSLVKPEYRKIVRVVGQPSFVEAYERTSIYPKVTGYIEKWNVDIGDTVKKGQVLARLFVPELVEDCETKHRTVKLEEEKVQLALEVVEVVKADVLAAEARVEEAEAYVVKYKSDVDRWDSEVKRLRREVERGVVDPQVLLESENQLRMSTAQWKAALATVKKAKAYLLAEKANLSKAIVDVEVKRRDVAVAESDAKRLDAWVDYLNLYSPYDGIVTGRNANTWDFVLPARGDPSADHWSPYLAPGNKAAPIYMVDRTDIVRIFVDIPESDANYVQIGTKAKVQIKGFRDKWIQGPGVTVTRTSWALNVKSRTLRAEIDLANEDQKILPGMYAYGKVLIERNDARAVPEAALMRDGDATYFWSYEDGKAVKTEVQTGISDGVWTEVTSRQQSTKSAADDTMVPVTGKEQVIMGDLSSLTTGDKVNIAGSTAKEKAE